MLASAPNMTCPEAHSINCQQSGKRSQLPAVHTVHSFTYAIIHAFIISSWGRGGRAKGKGGKIRLDASTSLSSSLLDEQQSACAYTLVSMLTTAFSSL